MKAVIYARFSDSKQKEESIDVQLKECRAYAKAHDLTIVGEYIDKATSGRTDKRPSFLKMIRDSSRSKFDFIITLKVDRFARNRFDSATYKAKLNLNHVKVLYARESIPDGPEGILLESMLEGYAEYYSANLRQNVVAGLNENALKCKSTGMVPFGYSTDAGKNYILDPATAPIVKDIFDRYAGGQKNIEILHYLNGLGVKTKYGKPFNQNAIVRILRNEKYTGLYSYLDIVVDGGIPAIVDKPLFAKVQIMMNKRKKAPNMKAEYLLTSKLTCGCCGKWMVGESGTGRRGGIYKYYKCSSQKKCPNSCTKKTVQKEYIEKLVVEMTLEYVLNDDSIAKIVEKVVALEKSNEDNAVISAMKTQLSEVEKSIRNLLKALEAGIITESTSNRLLELEGERKDLLINIQVQESTITEINPDELEFWLKQFQNGDVDSLEYQRKIIDLFVQKVILYDNKMIVLYNLSSGSNSMSIDVDVDLEAELENGSAFTTVGAPTSVNPNPNCIFVSLQSIVLVLDVNF